MIQEKTFEITISVCKHAATDTENVIFVAGFPAAFDIYTFKQGKINDDIRKVISDLAVVFGVHIAISDSPVGKDLGE